MKMTWVLRGDKLVHESSIQPNRAATHTRHSQRNFVSPVDGSVISSREQVREHNRRNGVSDVDSTTRLFFPACPSGQGRPPGRAPSRCSLAHAGGAGLRLQLN